MTSQEDNLGMSQGLLQQDNWLVENRSKGQTSWLLVGHSLMV